MEEYKKLNVLELLKLALNKEKDSFATLSNAGSLCSEKRLKKTLNKLAMEELKHILMLMDLSQVSSVDPLGEIDLRFPEVKRYPPGLKGEEEALRACMGSELESITLFMDLVDRAQEQEDDDVLRLLQQLVEEEEKHKKTLENLLANRLKEI